MAKVSLKKAIEELNSSGETALTYPSFLQAYKAGNIDSNVTNLIIIENRFKSKKYFIEEDLVEDFKINLLKQLEG